VSQEFDLNEVEIDSISFVPRGANRKKYFLVKEERSLIEDILKSILETDEDDVSSIVKEARQEGEAAGVRAGGGEERPQERRKGDRRSCRKPLQRGHRQNGPYDPGPCEAAPGRECRNKK